MSMISEDFLNNLRLLVRNEYRNEVREGTTIVGDCLVCRGSPSLDCLICKRKYSSSAATTKTGDSADDAVPKSTIITGFSEHFSRNSRVSAGGTGPTATISSGTQQHNAGTTPGKFTKRNGLVTSNDVGSLNEHILALRHQIQAKDVKIELLQESMDEATKNVHYWKQQFHLLKLKLEDRDQIDVQTRLQYQEMVDHIDALKAENSMLLDRARVSEACRSNSARELTRLRASHQHNNINTNDSNDVR